MEKIVDVILGFVAGAALSVVFTFLICAVLGFSILPVFTFFLGIFGTYFSTVNIENTRFEKEINA